MSDDVETDDAWPDSAFWLYSLDLYAKDGVEAACIALQDRRGVDVNLLLLAFWLASRGVPLDRGRLERIDGAVAGFRDQVVRPLRAARRHLRTLQTSNDPEPIATLRPRALDALRRDVAAAELDGERLIQLALESESDPLDGGRAPGIVLAAANVGAIARFEDADRDDLATLFSRALDGPEEQELTRALGALGVR